MPFDLTFDSGLIILIAAFDLFLLIRFFQFRRQIKVRGMVPGRLIMLGIVCAVVVIQACRGAFTQYTLAFNICTAVSYTHLKCRYTPPAPVSHKGPRPRTARRRPFLPG